MKKSGSREFIVSKLFDSLMSVEQDDAMNVNFSYFSPNVLNFPSLSLDFLSVPTI